MLSSPKGHLVKRYRNGLVFLHSNGFKRLHTEPKLHPLPSTLCSRGSTSIRKLRVKPALDINAYRQLLDACIRSKSLEEGQRIHQDVVGNSLYANNSLLLEKVAEMYASCGETGRALEVFDSMPQRSVFLWNAMIRSYAWYGPFQLALKMYEQMVDSGVEPNKFTFPFVLKACSQLVALEDGIMIHDHARRIGLEGDLYVSTALIDLYMKCGCTDVAEDVFHRMPRRDIVAWNAMVAGYASHGLYWEAIDLVLEMQKKDNSPNPSTMVALLPVVGQVKTLRQGKSIHGFCIRNCFHLKDILVNTALLDMYAKCEYLSYGHRIFDKMSARNEVTWSAMIAGYVNCGRMTEALGVFRKMMLEGSSSMAPSSFASILRACANLADLGWGRWVHCYLVKCGLLADIMLGNSILSMYAKVGNLDDAMNYFEEMDEKDVVSYSAVISGCVQNGNAEEAFSVFQRMQSSGLVADAATMIGVIPACSQMSALRHGRCCHAYVTIFGFVLDTSISNSLIDMYAKCGRIDLARRVFNRISSRDIVSWNTMITGYGIHGLGKEAVSLFVRMESACFSPDDVTFICLLSACSHSGLVAEGKHWFSAMTKTYNITPRMEHFVCMVDLLARGGYLDEAYDFTQSMPFEPDVRIWGALLGACRVHKDPKLGEEVARKIQKLGPEGTGSFVVLSNIYSAAGRYDEAAQVRIMQRKHGFNKIPGCSWIEIGGIMHAFIGGDKSHPQSSNIYQKLDELLAYARRLGYQADTSCMLHDVDVEEREQALVYHSEKLAIAFGLLNLRDDQTIFITKNLRVCGDCHNAIKYIASMTKRVITVRDANRFHHFKDDTCNCGDFW